MCLDMCMNMGGPLKVLTSGALPVLAPLSRHKPCCCCLFAALALPRPCVEVQRAVGMRHSIKRLPSPSHHFPSRGSLLHHTYVILM